MERIAIIGGGIAGLGAAWHLHDDHDVTLFEKNNYAGGHTNTRTVATPDGAEIPIDTGFMVFNHVTYPNLTRLFATLGVEAVETTMSFGVQHRPSGVEYSGSSLSQLFARRRNLLNLGFLDALRNVQRFNSEAHAAIDDPRWAMLTLQEYSDIRGYGENFLEYYLLPMAGAVWSTPFDKVRQFPALTLLRFFRNHGLLGGLGGHHQWLTVAGGAKTYVDRMRQKIGDRIALRAEVTSVSRDAGGVTVRLADGSSSRFDRVVIASHADEALAMLSDPSTEERRLLSRFAYQRNVALLHTDPAPMPRARRAWASWNYRMDREYATTVYWMNSLQPWIGRHTSENYFVSIDDPGLVNPDRVINSIVYHHPLFTEAAIDAQRALPSLNADRTFFCGSYFRYGFHEDAYSSGIEAAEALRRASQRRAA